MQHRCVLFLVLGVAALLVLGIVMLSSTAAFAQDSHGDPLYFVKRQLFWLGIAFLICIGAAVADYHYLQTFWWLLFAAAVVLLVLCFVPPIGLRINGANRWINLVIFNFQPSELGKLAAVVFLAWWFARQTGHAHEFLRGFVVPGLGVGVLLALIAPEVDIGTTALIGATMFVVMFVAGSNLIYIGFTAMAGMAGIITAALKIPERMGRIMGFLYPDQYPAEFYQQLQGLIAFGSGGVEGLGLGNGRQKLLYVPFAHTDFIFPMIGEELGLVWTLFIVFAYLVIILCGALISLRARDRFGMLLGFGLVTIIALQAAVNIGVTTSLLPNKGLPLPFISYGGSNLVFCLFSVGVLISIFRQGIHDKPDRITTRLRARISPRI